MRRPLSSIWWPVRTGARSKVSPSAFFVFKPEDAGVPRATREASHHHVPHSSRDELTADPVASLLNAIEDAILRDGGEGAEGRGER